LYWEPVWPSAAPPLAFPPRPSQMVSRGSHHDSAVARSGTESRSHSTKRANSESTPATAFDIHGRSAHCFHLDTKSRRARGRAPAEQSFHHKVRTAGVADNRTRGNYQWQNQSALAE